LIYFFLQTRKAQKYVLGLPKLQSYKKKISVINFAIYKN